MNEKDETMQMAKVDFKCTVCQRTHSHKYVWSATWSLLLFPIHAFYAHAPLGEGKRKI